MVENRPVRHALEEDGRAAGPQPEFITTDWRQGIDPKAVDANLREEKTNRSRRSVPAQRDLDRRAHPDRRGSAKAIDEPPAHPALLMVYTISSLASADYRHDEWGGVRHRSAARRRA